MKQSFKKEKDYLTKKEAVENLHYWLKRPVSCTVKKKQKRKIINGRINNKSRNGG